MANGGYNKVVLPDEELCELVEDYAQSKTAVQDFSKKKGISINTVYRILRDAGAEIRSGGEANSGTQVAENNPNWKGGITQDGSGYIVERDEDGKQRRQHRLVMERHLGRKLTPDEVVHHKNHDRSDNRIENLELYSSHSEHMKEHSDSETMRQKGKAGLESRYTALKARKETE